MLLDTILNQSLSFFALIGLLCLIFMFIYLQKIKFSTKMIIHIGLMLALTFILHMFRLYHMPQGGSVTLAGMLPLIILSLSYGPLIGFLSGFCYGLINLIQDPFIVHPIQVLFDYPLPYMALGIVGFFKNRVFLGVIVAISARFICHFISGTVFFASYVPQGVSPYWYSFIFNITYLLPELIICLIVISILPLKKLIKQMNS